MLHLRTGAVGLLFFATALLAQNTGRISGTVQDGTGAAIPGAVVSLYMPGGATAIMSTTTTNDGNYFLAGVQPVTYDLSIEAKGFRKEIYRAIKVDTGLELSMKISKLQVSSQAEVVEVSAQVTSVQTANAEVASTITNEQVRRLPTLNRSPLALISTQAGVGGNGRTNTTINGLRPSFANVTIDGINIQDNFIRTNGLDFQPNMLQLDQVGEFTVATSNTNASAGNGAAQVSFVTPSGSNDYHGSMYWFNRNNIASANTWFNNRNRVSRPFLNQNQAGGSFSGRLIKDKLFFYGNYEATRLRQQAAATRTLLTDAARSGIFTYRDTAGNIRQANVLTAAGVAADPKARAIINATPTAASINRTDIGDGLNTSGMGFNIRDNRTRDNVTGKVDYILSPKNVFTGTYIWNRDADDRADLMNNFSTAPNVLVSNKIPLLSVTWRWSPVSTITNELRGGFNKAPGVFTTSEEFGAAIIAPTLISNPVNTFRGQGRYTDTYNLQDNANWFKGKHSVSFGFTYQNIHADPFNDAGNIPTYTMGISAANTKGLNADKVPGVRASDLAIANNLLALHAGYITTATQTFNVTSRDSGFVNGANNYRRLRQQNYAFYFTDTWRISNRLTATLGTRWEYYTPVDERDSLYLLPELNGKSVIDVLRTNATLSFAGNSAGRPWYGKDFNNFSPNIGLAWQPFADNGRTVLRAGYSINFPNDELIRSVDNNVGTNAGLSSVRTLTNLTATLNSGLPAISTPVYKVPRTLADNYALSPTSAVGIPDPNLRTPYVQQWSFGIQREIAKGVLELRYVGNHATKQFRAIDYNQILTKVAGGGTTFDQDFKRALNNGNLARSATGAFNPVYNPNIAGSQALPFFAILPSGGLLTNATIRGLVERGEMGELANIYQVNALNGPVNFYANPLAQGTNVMTNYSNATYNALQVDYRKTFGKGVTFQTNYTYSKGMSDAAGDAQARFEPFLDINNAAIERARTPFDLTHSLKFNGAYDLPVGKGRSLNVDNPVLNQIVGGWTVSGFYTLTSGAPFSVLAPRNTLNRSGRSTNNTATTLLNKGQLDDLLQFRQTGNGPYFIAASALGADGRATNADGIAPFAGQAFYNPAAAGLGALQRRMFSGPAFWNIDFAILKSFQIFEKQRVEFRSEFFNLTNSPSFFIGDQDINSATFGRITSTNSGRRIIQFGLYYRF